MPYSKQTWTDAPAQTTPVDAARLGHIEDGIEAAANVGDAAATAIALAAEATTRSSADIALALGITNEAASRSAADAAEVTARNTAIATAIANLINAAPSALDTLKELADALGDDANFAATFTGLISAEATARASADTALSTSITNEATTRASAVSTLTTNLSSESTTRANADTTLQANIDAEATARAAAVTSEAGTRATAVTNESTARASADTTLQANIDAEASARGTAITSEASTRATAVSAEATARASADTTLQANIDAEAAARTSADAAEVTARNTAIANAVAALVASSPAALDTLKELADALGDDANYAATITAALALKAPLNAPALVNPTVGTQTPGDSTTKAASTAFVAAAIAANPGLPSAAANTVVAGPVSGGAATAAARALVPADLPAAALTDGRPATANAWDEEFDSGLGGFVNLNIANGATVTVAKGAVAILRPAADASDTMRGIVKAAPAGAFTVEAKVSINGLGATWQLFGLGVRRGGGTAPNAANTSTDKLSIMGPGFNSGGSVEPGLYSLKTTTGSGVSGSSGMNGTTPLFRLGSSGTLYVRIAFDGSDTLTWTASNDGIGWVTYFSGSATTLLGGAPDSVCLAMNNESAADCVGVCCYVRRIA